MNWIPNNGKNYLQIIYAPSNALENLEILHPSLHAIQTNFSKDAHDELIRCSRCSKKQRIKRKTFIVVIEKIYLRPWIQWKLSGD